ncbi:hypothetical protein OESDEN_06904 [Oesophagostomum dentatum]|uniref:Glycine zipper domain-containing protein n=1 Tax=Oesophagostomum dentatum TaxID=61180 RepID=A0A0B1TCX3_OESDE|nr:hypothetical protein OESDEN_06904 [Oesophagostomum dentatum]
MYIYRQSLIPTAYLYFVQFYATDITFEKNREAPLCRVSTSCLNFVTHVSSPFSQTQLSKMSVVYLNEVLRIMGSSKPLRDTLVGVAKQTGCAAAGTAAGGLLMGPLGALVGGVVGAMYGYQCSDDYDNLICSLRSMSEREKTIITGQIQRLVGSASIEEFVRYISTEAHRELLLGILADFVRQKAQNA